MKVAPFLTLALVAFGATPGPAQHSFPPPPGSRIVQEDWQSVRMEGTQIGHSHVVTYQGEVEDGIRFTTDAEFAMEFGRLGASNAIRIAIRQVEDGDQKMRRVEAAMEMSNNPFHLTGIVEGEVMKVSCERMGRTWESELEWEPDVASPQKIRGFHRQLIAAPAGTKVTFRTYDATIGQIVTYHVENKGREVIEHRGEQVQATLLSSLMEIMPGMEIQSWLADDGTVLLEKQPFVGGAYMVFERCPREEATGRAGDPDSPRLLDLFAETMLQCNVPIPRPRRVDEVLYRLTLRDGVDEWPVLPDDARQVIESRADRSLNLRITRREPTPGKVSRPITDAPPEIADALAPSSSIESDDPDLVRMAGEVVGDETDAWTAAQLLERWAYEHIEKKNFETVLASAAEVFRERRGDCSEHAVLLAAMCRAVGIPARIVMGLEYVQGIFGGHAWTEVWIDGWYALDATNAYGGVDAAHISLAASAMGDATGMGEFVSLGAALGNLEIEILELRYGDRVVDTAGGVSWIEFRDGLLMLTLLDVTIAVPEGWQYHDTAETEGLQTQLCKLAAPDDSRTVEVHMASVPYDFDLDAIARSKGGDGSDSWTEVDGRRALLIQKPDRAMVFVLLEDTLFFLTTETLTEDDAPWGWFTEFLGRVKLGS